MRPSFTSKRMFDSTRATLPRLRVVLDMSVDRVAHRRDVDLAVGDVAAAVALHRRQPLDAEAQVGARPRDVHAVGPLEQRVQRVHRATHACVVERAHLVVEIGEILGRTLGRLCHGRVRVAQHAPLLVQPHRNVHLPPIGLVVPALAVGIDIGKIERVGAAAHADVGVDRLHDRAMERAPVLELLLAGVADEAAADRLVVVVPEGHAAVLGGHAHQFTAQFEGVEALDLDVDLLAPAAA
jgi:hypothetical protein